MGENDNLIIRDWLSLGGGKFGINKEELISLPVIDEPMSIFLRNKNHKDPKLLDCKVIDIGSRNTKYIKVQEF